MTDGRRRLGQRGWRDGAGEPVLDSLRMRTCTNAAVWIKQASKKFNKIRLDILVIKEGIMTDFMGYMCFKVIFFQNIDLKERVKNSD